LFSSDNSCYPAAFPSSSWFLTAQVALLPYIFRHPCLLGILPRGQSRATNEFIKIKKEFAEEAQEQEIEAVEDLPNRQIPKHQLPDDDDGGPDNVPF
jgi:hypothetical protein